MFGLTLLISVLQICHLSSDLDLGLVAAGTEILNVPRQLLIPLWQISFHDR